MNFISNVPVNLEVEVGPNGARQVAAVEQQIADAIPKRHTGAAPIDLVVQVGPNGDRQVAAPNHRDQRYTGAVPRRRLVREPLMQPREQILINDVPAPPAAEFDGITIDWEEEWAVDPTPPLIPQVTRHVKRIPRFPRRHN